MGRRRYPKYAFSNRERMQALGGRFDLHSIPGEGTTATLVLPFQKRECPAKISVPALSLPEAGHSIPSAHGATATRVLIVDNHAMVRQGLRSVLESYPDLQVVGEASNGAGAIELTKQLQPSLVLMDVNMPVMNGIEATAKIKTRQPEIVVIGMSVNASSDNNDAMRTAGASVLLTKEAAEEQLHRAIQDAIKAEPSSAGLASIPSSHNDLDHLS